MWWLPRTNDAVFEWDDDRFNAAVCLFELDEPTMSPADLEDAFRNSAPLYAHEDDRAEFFDLIAQWRAALERIERAMIDDPSFWERS